MSADTSEDDCPSIEEEFPSTCEQIELDEAIARTLKDKLNFCNSNKVIAVPLGLESQPTATPNGNYADINNYKDVVHGLASEVKYD